MLFFIIFIYYIDSIKLNSLIDKETRERPVLLNFENTGRRNDSQHVKLQTEYRLFTYYNNTKYYLDIARLDHFSSEL